MIRGLRSRGSCRGAARLWPCAAPHRAPPEGAERTEPLCTVLPRILAPQLVSAHELSARYHERREAGTIFNQLKAPLRGRGIVLRSKTPELLRREIPEPPLAHHALRGIPHEAALQADLDPDELSFVQPLRVVERKILLSPSLSVEAP